LQGLSLINAFVLLASFFQSFIILLPQTYQFMLVILNFQNIYIYSRFFYVIFTYIFRCIVYLLNLMYILVFIIKFALKYYLYLISIRHICCIEFYAAVIDIFVMILCVSLIIFQDNFENYLIHFQYYHPF
jgi:hypothetical protein